MKLSLERVALIIGAPAPENSLFEVSGINNLKDASINEISFAISEKYIKLLSKTNAGAVIINKKLKDYSPCNCLIVDDAYLAFAKLSHHFKEHQSIISEKEICKFIDISLKVKGVSISSGCFLGKNVNIGTNTKIGPNCTIEDNVTIGSNSVIESNVTIQKGCLIGDKCMISPGVVIGSEGFGNVRDSNNKWTSIAHLGNASIGNNVSIGANTTIDRGTISNTEIHDGVKIDNLVHIAHNVIIGKDTAIAAKTGIAGTTVIGKRCMIGGAVGIVDHLKIVDDVVINATSTVNRDISKPGMYTGFVPLMLHSEWKKVSIWLTKLDKIAAFMKIKLKNIR